MTRDEYAIRQREFSARGEDLPWSKLTDSKVREARRIYQKAKVLKKRLDTLYSIEGLAKKYGVSPGAMEKALNYTTWRHVK